MTDTPDLDALAESAMPCLIKLEGSLGSGVLLPGVAYRVDEIWEHWEPTGVVGEGPRITTVIRFIPVWLDREAAEPR